MPDKYQINLGGYEGHFNCPNCHAAVDIQQGNSSDVFECRSCGRKYLPYVKDITGIE